MGITTFSGPIKAGTIKDTTGTTLGSDIANVGQVVMTQTFSADLSGGALAASVTDVVIPANSQIIDLVIDVITAANATTNLSVGDTVGGAATVLRYRYGRYSTDCYCFCRYKRRFGSFHSSVRAKQQFSVIGE